MPRRPALAAVCIAVLVGCGCRSELGAMLPPAPVTPSDEAVAAAEAQISAGKVEAALESYREATLTDRTAVRPHLRYVRAMLAQGRRAELREIYSGRVARPDATDAERTVSERLQTNGASSALRRVYTAAADRNPKSPWWRLALVEVETAEADAWNHKRLDAIERSDRQAERQAFAQAGSAVRRAARALERATKIDPGLAEVHLYRGFLRAVEGDLQANAQGRDAGYRAAAASFSVATGRAPGLVEAWAGLGDAQFRVGETRAALVAYLEAVRLAPADADLRVALGVVLHEVGRLREASNQYSQAAQLRAWDADPLLRMGDARADARDIPGALAAYERALKRDPDAIEAYYRMGTIYEFQGRLGEARAAYERYVEQDGANASTVQRRIERMLRQEQK